MSSVFAPFTKAPDLGPPAVIEPEPGSGLFDVPGNLLSDIADAAVGLPGGLVHFFRDPVESAEDIAKATWHDWSPLFQGEFGKWFEQTAKHPLGPILDVAAFATGGATLAGKTATKLAKQGTFIDTIDRAPKIADVAKPGESFELGDLIEGLEKPLIEAGPATVSRTFVPKYGEGSKVRRLADYTQNREVSFDPFTGRQITPGRLEYHDPLHNRPVEFKNLPSNRPLQKWVMQKQHELSIKLSQDLPDLFGPKEVGKGMFGLRTMGQQARYETRALRNVAQNHTALYAYFGIVMDAAKKLDGADEAGIKSYWKDVTHGNYDNAVQHARTHEAGMPLPTEVGNFEGTSWTYLRAEPNLDDLPIGWQGDGFTTLEKNLKQLGRVITTPTLKNAKRVPGEPGKVYIVPHHSMRALGIEGGNSAKFLQTLYRSPTTIWKTIMLGYAPRFFVNNAIGNMTLYLLAQGGGSAMRGLVDAYRQVYKEDVLGKGMDAQAKLASRGYINNHFADQLAGILQSQDIHDAYMKEALEKRGGKPSGINKFAEDMRNNKINLFGVTHKYADLFIRQAAINAKTREIPEVRMRTRQLEEQGVQREVAFDRAADEFYSANRLERDRVSQATFDIMGDYVSLGPTERVVREFVPFYSWDRHILRTTKTLARDRPLLTAFLAHWGMEGTEYTQEMLDTVLPDFLKGAIPAPGFLNNKLGREAIIPTHGLNPFATVPDILNAGWAFALPGHKPVSSTLGSQINPLLQGGIESITGTSLLTGEPRRGDGNLGFLGGTANNILFSLPGVNIAKAVLDPDKPKDPNKPFLYSKDQWEAIGAWTGLPVKWVNLKRAQELAKQQIKLEGG